MPSIIKILSPPHGSSLPSILFLSPPRRRLEFSALLESYPRHENSISTWEGLSTLFPRGGSGLKFYSKIIGGKLEYLSSNSLLSISFPPNGIRPCFGRRRLPLTPTPLGTTKPNEPWIEKRVHGAPLISIILRSYTAS